MTRASILLVAQERLLSGSDLSVDDVPQLARLVVVGETRTPGAVVAGLSLADFHSLEVREARRRVAELKTKTGQGELARRELESRLGYLERVGLGYLTLDRQARTLSGGEAQRVTLTAALGTSLHNALCVLDEPTVGLHPTDVAPLVTAMRELARRKNVVLVVEHLH